MPTADNRSRITVDLGDSNLYKALRHAAVERGEPLREVVVEALKEWLKRQEDLEDVADMDATKGEPAVPWSQMKGEIRAAESRGE